MEGDAGTRRLNPTHADAEPDDADAEPDDADATPDESVAATELPDELVEPQDSVATTDTRRPSRLGRGWLAGICAILVVLAAGAAAGGYLALRSHADSEAIASNGEAALKAAQDCIAATHAPDMATMTASQAKIIECSTGDFGVQATLFSGVLVDAYEAANVTVQVSDLRAAVERHHDDGSVDVLVAVRVSVTNSQVDDQEQGYRLRVKMAPADGTYKVAELNQVTS